MSWVQRGLAIASGVVIAFLAWRQLWPFQTEPAGVGTFDKPSVWQYLFSDRYVLGMLRLGLAAVALYFVVSVPALVAAARWVKGFGSSGLTADEAQEASVALEDYEKELADLSAKLDKANATISQVRHQRDTAIRIFGSLRSPTTSTMGPGARAVGTPIVEEGGSDVRDEETDLGETPESTGGSEPGSGEVR